MKGSILSPEKGKDIPPREVTGLVSTDLPERGEGGMRKEVHPQGGRRRGGEGRRERRQTIPLGGRRASCGVRGRESTREIQKRAYLGRMSGDPRLIVVHGGGRRNTGEMRGSENRSVHLGGGRREETGDLVSGGGGMIGSGARSTAHHGLTEIVTLSEGVGGGTTGTGGNVMNGIVGGGRGEIESLIEVGGGRGEVILIVVVQEEREIVILIAGAGGGRREIGIMKVVDRGERGIETMKVVGSGGRIGMVEGGGGRTGGRIGMVEGGGGRRGERRGMVEGGGGRRGGMIGGMIEMVGGGEGVMRGERVEGGGGRGRKGIMASLTEEEDGGQEMIERQTEIEEAVEVGGTVNVIEIVNGTETEAGTEVSRSELNCIQLCSVEQLLVNSLPTVTCLTLQTVVLGVLMIGGPMRTGREDHQKEELGRGKGVTVERCQWRSTRSYLCIYSVCVMYVTRLSLSCSSGTTGKVEVHGVVVLSVLLRARGRLKTANRRERPRRAGRWWGGNVSRVPMIIRDPLQCVV